MRLSGGGRGIKLIFFFFSAQGKTRILGGANSSAVGGKLRYGTVATDRDFRFFFGYGRRFRRYHYDSLVLCTLLY